MDWTYSFYSQQEAWLGPAQVFPYDQARAAAVERLAGEGQKRILELGAGSGGAAVALAERGHEVVAVELVAVHVVNARRLAQAPMLGSVQIVEADFYTYTSPTRFDVVCYWDGFGIGADADQRRLLQRIADHWLTPQGCALIDVYHPCSQILAAGQEHVNPKTGVKRRYDYDPLHGRFIDRWQAEAEPEKVFTQALRCYTPPDLRLLLEGTGLKLERIEVNQAEVDLAAQEMTFQTPLGKAWSYLAKLVRA